MWRVGVKKEIRKNKLKRANNQSYGIAWHRICWLRPTSCAAVEQRRLHLLLKARCLSGSFTLFVKRFAASFAPDGAPMADVQEHIRKLYEVFEREASITFGTLGIV